MTQAVSRTDKNKPHYEGHRNRLRDRFLKNGTESLQDYEVLELLLFMALPRRDVKPLAKNLLTKFGSLGKLVRATVSDLQQEGLSETLICHLKLLEAASLDIIKSDIMHKPILNSWDRLIAFLQADMAHSLKEHFRLLFLNKKNELIAEEIQQSGTIDHTQAYPREIIKRALDVGATALILVHNHPSGDPKPSQADIEMTKSILKAAEAFDIVIHDHVIIAKKGHFSFRQSGLMS
jgi:DNA repair protein RadC